jgi:hypothetical protein
MQVSKIATGGSVVARLVLPRDESLQAVAAGNPGSLDPANLREPRAYFLQRVAVAWGMPSLTVRASPGCSLCDLGRGAGGAGLRQSYIGCRHPQVANRRGNALAAPRAT